MEKKNTARTKTAPAESAPAGSADGANAAEEITARGAENFPFEKITAPLVKWFNENKRDLPWRHNPEPYRVWVSEIMLQQTRVEAAREYYLRFLSALPSVSDLAACDEEKLMKLWEGLGYYSRVRNMQKTAKIVCEKYGGNFPSDEKSLRALPGIGDYTAGAIRSIAFGLPSPAVDGNVLRVCSRLAADCTDISDATYKARLKALLLNAYPNTPQGCSDFTQALMELGALICTPRVISCEKCPLRALCRAEKLKKTEEYPVMPEKKEKRAENVWAFVIETPRGYSVRKRDAGVLKGMNEFPSLVVPQSETTRKGGADGDADGGIAARAEQILKDWGVEEPHAESVEKYTHIFTHVRWEVTAFFVRAKSSPFDEYAFSQLIGETAFPTAFRRCIDLLKDKRAKRKNGRVRKNESDEGGGKNGSKRIQTRF